MTTETPEGFFPTGSTLLNLACSDDPFAGYGQGTVVNVVGDSSSSKTFLALTTLAMAAHHKRFADYELIHDDAEYACNFDLPGLFGAEAAARIHGPRNEEGEWRSSESVEEFESSLYTYLDMGKPFIYVLDSLDSIFSQDSKGVDVANAKAREKGNKEKGSYEMQKAKKMSSLLRNVRADLAKNHSLLIIISQTRDNVEGGMFAPKSTRSGGRALEFYCTHVIWLKCLEKIKRGARKLEVGRRVLAEVSKNKMTGKPRKVEYSVYFDYGLDDITSNVSFMIEVGKWKKTNGIIVPSGLFDNEKFREAELVEVIERDNLETKLATLVGQAWRECEAEIATGRKGRF